MGVFLLASVALAVVLLLSTRTASPEAGQRSAASAAPTSFVIIATPVLATPAPSPRPTQPGLRITVTVLEPNYTVEPGDTLSAIARRFGTNVEALEALNRLERGATLRIGQKLIVPKE